ncbi:Cys-tRNA(Pro) deacylase [Propionibacterium cyclohexanicum]|nr:Cys-tRNA(Pro) deacylase [Propionibacterium cyclohexanicum]
MSKSARRSVGTPATLALDRAGVPHELHAYSHDPRSHHFGTEAAALLGVDPSRVFKTLVVELSGADVALVTAVVPASGQLSLKAIAAHSHAKKAALADPAVAQRATGYVVGGISPLGQKHQTPVFIDSSSRAFETIFVSGGRRGLSVEIAPHDLSVVTHGSFAELSG